MFSIFLISIFLSITSFAAAINNYSNDIVTLKNGDSYNGTVAHGYFSIETIFGKVRIPYVAMALLSFSESNSMATIYTQQNEIFYGDLEGQELKLFRVLGPVLPVATADIKEIVFSSRKSRQTFKNAEDSIETEIGIRFFGQVKNKDFMLQNATSLQIFNRSDLHLIDFSNLLDGQQQMTQFTFNNGRRLQGKPMHQSFTVQTRFGQILKIPIQQLSTIALNVNRSLKQAHFNYRRRILGNNIIQDYLTDGSPAPEVVVLRGGNYIRGQKQGDRDELPAITKVKPFAIGIYEVTFIEYQQFCRDTLRPNPDDGGFGRGFRPVINVSWQDAKAYTEWLSRKTHQTYRLPTDAEWEYAARGGTNTRFWWSENLIKGNANCSGCGSIWDAEKTAPVGRFLPNPYGLHDTAGNVFEWVEDCFHNDFLKAPINGSAYVTENCGQRVIRGGAWSFPPTEVRSANRWRDIPSRHSDDTGFRVVRELD